MDFPPIVELVPHKPPMVLLDRVLSYSTDFVCCAVEIRPDSAFVQDGGVPAVVGMEYMAQCVAVFAGLNARENGQPARIGLLLGSRELRFDADLFPVGDRLTVEARRTWGENTLGSFACRVLRGTDVLVQGTLNVYQGQLPEQLSPGTRQ
jgi:predicted hotdog family 3-hydroxylacyl-ACP dehydratase